jgi:hypothetical protein
MSCTSDEKGEKEGGIVGFFVLNFFNSTVGKHLRHG